MTAKMTVELAAQDQAAAAAELAAQKGWSRRRDKRTEALRERRKAAGVALVSKGGRLFGLQHRRTQEEEEEMWLQQDAAGILSLSVRFSPSPLPLSPSLPLSFSFSLFDSL